MTQDNITVTVPKVNGVHSVANCQEGALVYDTTTSKLMVSNGIYWSTVRIDTPDPFADNAASTIAPFADDLADFAAGKLYTLDRMLDTAPDMATIIRLLQDVIDGTRPDVNTAFSDYRTQKAFEKISAGEVK